MPLSASGPPKPVTPHAEHTHCRPRACVVLPTASRAHSSDEQGPRVSGSLTPWVSLLQLPGPSMVEVAATCWGQPGWSSPVALALTGSPGSIASSSSEGQPAAGGSLKWTWLFRFHSLFLSPSVSLSVGESDKVTGSDLRHKQNQWPWSSLWPRSLRTRKAPPGPWSPFIPGVDFNVILPVAPRRRPCP